MDKLYNRILTEFQDYLFAIKYDLKLSLILNDIDDFLCSESIYGLIIRKDILNYIKENEEDIIAKLTEDEYNNLLYYQNDLLDNIFYNYENLYSINHTENISAAIFKINENE